MTCRLPTAAGAIPTPVTPRRSRRSCAPSPTTSSPDPPCKASRPAPPGVYLQNGLWAGVSCLEAAVAPLQYQQNQGDPQPNRAECQSGDPAGCERHGDSGEPSGHPGQLVQGLRDTEDGRPVLLPDLVLHRESSASLARTCPNAAIRAT